MQSKLDSILRATGSCCLTLAMLLLAIGVVGRPLERPLIAYGLLGIGLLAYACLAMRGLNARSALGAVVIYSAFGAASGTFAIAIGRAIASQSWGLVTVLVLISMLVAGVSFWWNARQRNVGKE